MGFWKTKACARPSQGSSVSFYHRFAASMDRAKYGVYPRFSQSFSPFIALGSWSGKMTAMQLVGVFQGSLTVRAANLVHGQTGAGNGIAANNAIFAVEVDVGFWAVERTSATLYFGNFLKVEVLSLIGFVEHLGGRQRSRIQP